MNVLRVQTKIKKKRILYVKLLHKLALVVLSCRKDEVGCGLETVHRNLITHCSKSNNFWWADSVVSGC